MGCSSLRCSECRKAFRPEVSATTTQRVCGSPCRSVRNRKLARIRRSQQLEEARTDERERQRACRERRDASSRHAPASRDKAAKAQGEVADFVDRALARSRATLVREISGMIRGIKPSAGIERQLSRASLDEQPHETKSDFA